MNPPRIALVFLATITVVQIAYYRPRLPASVASHFDLAALFAALFFFTAEASVRGSHRIPPQALWGLLGALLGGVGWLAYRTWSRFASARPA